jgi:hypothetical protein
VHDLSLPRHPLDRDELDPLDMPANGDLHEGAVSHLHDHVRYNR